VLQSAHTDLYFEGVDDKAHENCCSVLQCVAVCYIVLQCVIVCCSVHTQTCVSRASMIKPTRIVAACCSVL